MNNRYLILTSLLIFFSFLLIFLLSSSPSVTGGDAGEYLAAVKFLGNNHPPGNPLYSIIASALSSILPGSEYFRVTAVSSILSAVALLLMAAALFELTQSIPISVSVVILLSSLNPVFINATTIEVYAAFHLGSLILFLLAISKWDPPQKILLYAFLSGLFMGIHYLSIVTSIAIAPFLLRDISSGTFGKKQVAGSFFLFLSGYLIFLYLPVRSLAGASLDYGQPQDVKSLGETLLWSQFSWRPSAGRTFLLTLKQAYWTLSIFLKESGMFISATLFGGIILNFFKGKKEVWIALSILLLHLMASVILQNFPSYEMTRQELPKFLGIQVIFACYISAYFFVTLAGAISANYRYVKAAVVYLLLLLSIISLTTTIVRQNRSSNYFLEDYFTSALLSVNHHGALAVEGDTQIFSMLNLQMIKDLRPDVKVLDRSGNFFDPGFYNFSQIPSQMQEEHAVNLELSLIDSGLYYVSLPESISSMRNLIIRRAGFVNLVAHVSPHYRINPLNPIRYVRVPPNISSSSNSKESIYLVTYLLEGLLSVTGKPGSIPDDIFQIAHKHPLPLLALGDTLMLMNRPEEALRAFRESIHMYPYNREAYEKIIPILYRLRKDDEFERYLRMSSATTGVPLKIRFMAGTYYLKKKDMKAALKHFRVLEKAGELTPSLLNNMGLAFLWDGDEDRAREYFSRAISLFPEYKGAIHNLRKLDQSR